jgi:SAM-dependent methyltransferase
MPPDRLLASPAPSTVRDRRSRHAVDRSGAVLRLPARAISQVARRHGQGFNIPLIAARQAFSEAWVKAFRNASFRGDRNDDSLQGYCAMTAGEFAGVNARQRWANWRTIPRNLDGVCPNRPLAIVDLCCGIGDSTTVLAWYAPPGSAILGLEYNPGFVERARARDFRDERGRAIAVSFRAQSVLERFRDHDGADLGDASVDLVNSSGAVGCHFDAAATATLAAEVARVLVAGGLALIDAGDQGTSEAEVERVFSAVGCERLGHARSCAFDRYVQICFRKRG